MFPFRLAGLSRETRLPSSKVVRASEFDCRVGLSALTQQSVLYTLTNLQRGRAGTRFRGNQLSPDLIGLLPLDPGLGSDLHVSTPILASIGLSPDFALPRSRSSGFWSQSCDLRPLSDPIPHLHLHCISNMSFHESNSHCLYNVEV